jgi:protein prenyltransferase alpha subunit repeat containing protein 1
LYKSYITANRLYQHSRKLVDQSPEPLLDSTSIILIANPAHQSALNTRKRLVMKGVLDPALELKFTASLLSCRECAKESILWHHRRWLLYRMRGNTNTGHRPRASCAESPWPLSSEIVGEEFTIISRACELYPRNYHAWAHRYFCMKSLCLSANSESVSTEAFTCRSALFDEYRVMTNWIDRHISDYSAMQYMRSLEQTIHNLPLDGINVDGSSLETTMSTQSHAQTLLRSYPDHESLWMYLRISSTDPTLADYPASADHRVLTSDPSYASSYLLRHLGWTANKVSSER